MNARSSEQVESSRFHHDNQEPDGLLTHEQFLTLQRYAEGVASGLWILALVSIWIRMFLMSPESRIDQVLFVVMLISLAVQLFILIVRSLRVKREPGWELSHRLKRWGLFAAMGTALLLGTLVTLFLRIAQWL